MEFSISRENDEYEGLTAEEKIGYLERFDVSKDMERFYRSSGLEKEAGKLSVPIMLSGLSGFLKTQKKVDSIPYPAKVQELTAAFDIVAISLGYHPGQSVIYRFREVETGTVGGEEAVDEVPIPTIDFFSYFKGNRKLFHALLYDGLGSHYFHQPKGSLIVCPENNPDFSGSPLDMSKLTEPQGTLLARETADMSLKEVDKVGLAKVLVRKINRDFRKLEMPWEDFSDELIW